MATFCHISHWATRLQLLTLSLSLWSSCSRFLVLLICLEILRLFAGFEFGFDRFTSWILTTSPLTFTVPFTATRLARSGPLPPVPRAPISSSLATIMVWRILLLLLFACLPESESESESLSFSSWNSWRGFDGNEGLSVAGKGAHGREDQRPGT